jgi:SSS family solute:Na+ symporter
MAGKGYDWGLVGAWWMLVGAIGLFMLYGLFARTLRNYHLYTLPELLDRHYGGSVKTAASLIITGAWIGVIGGQIVAAGRILTTLLPGNFSLMMVIAALVFIAYTCLGGQISIIRTDTVQSVIMMLGIFVCAVFSIKAVGGFPGLGRAVPADYLRFPVNDNFSWRMLVEWIVLIGSVYLVGPDIYTRLFSSRDDCTAQRSVLLVAMMIIPFAFAITLIGMTAKVLAPGIAAEQAFPYMIKAGLPRGVNALVMAALLCAVMSSADTVLLTTSTIFSLDVINPLIGRLRGTQLGQRSLLILSRLSVLFFGLLSLAFALHLREVIGLLLFGYSVYTAGLVVPVLLGFYRRQLSLTSTGAWWAVVGGGGWVILSKFSVYVRLGLGEFTPMSVGFEGFLLSIVLLFAGSYVGRVWRRRSH